MKTKTDSSAALALFLARGGSVVRVAPSVAPWRMAGCRLARYVLEVGPGEAARLGIEEGMVLTVEPAFERRARRLNVSPLTKA